MKKLLALLLVFVLVIGCFAGCSKGGETNTSSGEVSSEDVSSEEQVSSEEESSNVDTGEDGGDDYNNDYNDYNNNDYNYPEEPNNNNTNNNDVQTPSEDNNTNTGDDDFEEVELTAEEKRLETMLAGEDAEFNKDAIYKEGNLTRLAKAIKKSKSGKKVLIMFYGNSANTGDGYADAPYWRLFGEWWSVNIGPCEVAAASMDNLTSIDACMRVDNDILRWNPDVVFLDFAVQDAMGSMSTTNAHGYDNLIRRILQGSSKPAVVSLILTGVEQESYRMNAANADIFSSASKLQKEIASYHNIPVIDFEGALWDNMVELVKVTTKMEISLMTWTTVGENNVAMNNDGHMILCGAISNFMTKVNKKLNKISTKDYAYPTSGYYGTDKYMKGSLVDVVSIANGEAKGYAFDTDKLKEYDYFLGEKSTVAGSNLLNYDIMRTYRHYIAGENATETEKEYETGPHYLGLTLPEVKSTETVYFTMNCTKSYGNKIPAVTGIKAYAPITLECYGKDGNKIADVKNGAGFYSEAIEFGKTLRLQLPTGTTKIVIKVYSQGGILTLFGVGYFK